MLEEGEYILHLGKNSHEDWASKTFEIGETLAYVDSGAQNGAKAIGKRTSDGIVAENTFDDVRRYIQDGYMTVMSRSDFAGTTPTAPTLAKTAPDYVVKANAAYDKDNDTISGVKNKDALLYREDKPTSGADNGLTLSSLRGLAYNDNDKSHTPR